MEFVLVKDWSEAEDGKFNASKVVEEEVFGQKENGIWKQVGRTGHFRLRERESAIVRDITVEEQGDGMFVEQAIKAKREAIASVKASTNKERHAVAVETPRPSVDALLRMVAGAGANSTAEGMAASTEVELPPSQDTGASEQPSEEDDDTAEHNRRLLLQCGQPRGGWGREASRHCLSFAIQKADSLCPRKFR